MGWLLALIVIVIVVAWLGYSLLRADLPPASDERPAVSRDPASHSDAESLDDDDSITIIERAIPRTAIDLRHGEQREFSIVGASYWTRPKEISQYPGRVFYLRREPDNQFDVNAVAVYGEKRKFGYLAASAAAQYAPMLDQIGTEFVVERAVDHWAGNTFFLPRVPVLRKQIANDEIQPYVPVLEDSQSTGRPRVVLRKPSSTLTGGYPLFSGPHNNGDRIYGYTVGYASDLQVAGTPNISSLARRSTTQIIEQVRIGDLLELRGENGTLFVEIDGQCVGKLNWRDDGNRFDGGTMEVHRVFISVDGRVVNCGGIATPPRNIG